MADVHTPGVRSYNMSRIRNKNTKPEMTVRKFLHSQGFRFRLHVNDLPGKPDIVLKKFQTVINIHGCFWHGHSECKYFKIPSTRTEWWLNKIGQTIQKDIHNKKTLISLGWQVIEIWECDLKPGKIKSVLAKLPEQINSKVYAKSLK